METVGGLLIKIQQKPSFGVEHNLWPEKEKKDTVTIDSNLYNGWVLVKLPNLRHHQKNSEDHMVTWKEYWITAI